MGEKFISEAYLYENPNHIFVFGDNLQRVGKGGAAALRHMKNVYGFITKKTPSHDDSAYYRPQEYLEVYLQEIKLLKDMIEKNPDKKFLISKVGAGLANKYNIFERVIKVGIREHLGMYSNVEFLWD